MFERCGEKKRGRGRRTAIHTGMMIEDGSLLRGVLFPAPLGTEDVLRGGVTGVVVTVTAKLSVVCFASPTTGNLRPLPPALPAGVGPATAELPVL